MNTTEAVRPTTARELLHETEARLGTGENGDATLKQLADRAWALARSTGDVEAEALAPFYQLYPWVMMEREDRLMPRVQAAIDRARVLGVKRAEWLLSELQAYVLAVHGRHMESWTLSQRTERQARDNRPAFERSVAQMMAWRCAIWMGRLDEGLEAARRSAHFAQLSPHPLWHACSLVSVGGLLTREALNPELGLPHTLRGRELLRGFPPFLTTLVTTSQVVAALDMLGDHDRAYEVFREDLARPGMRELLRPGGGLRAAPVRARLTSALIGVGRLDEAQAWLDEIPREAYETERFRNAIEPVMRVRLLCAQGRHAEARALAEAERDRPQAHARAPYDHLTLLDRLRQACEALGDHAAAAQAAAAARETCLPLVGLSARSRYLATQLERNPGQPLTLNATDQRRIEAIHREVQAQARPQARLPASARAGPPASAQTTPQVPRFLAHVVHELRNPIGGMMGLSSLLLMSNLDDKQRRHTSAMQSSAITLLQLVNDVLDLAKLESGQFSLNPEPFELASWLQEGLAPTVVTGQLKGLDVTGQVDPALPARLVGDPMRLRQVLCNYLTNALKFTSSGRIEVRLRQVGTTPDGTVLLRLEVEDTGKGITAEALGRLFQEFVQADDSIARDHGGTGLGLALCRQLADRMGGQVGASSQPGVGSLFWLDVGLPRG